MKNNPPKSSEVFNKLLTWILVLVVLGIWGSIVYQLVVDTGAGKGTQATDESSPSIVSGMNTYRYTADVRDPFQPLALTQKEVPVKRVVSAPPPLWVPPPFKLTGIIENRAKKTAVVEGSNGETYFLVEGDSVGGVKIVAIEKEKVAYRYANQEKEWMIER